MSLIAVLGYGVNGTWNGTVNVQLHLTHVTGDAQSGLHYLPNHRSYLSKSGIANMLP